MARITGLQCGMSTLGCMLLVYFMSVTGVSSESSSKTATVPLELVKTPTATPSQTTPGPTISSTATTPVTTPSTTTKPTKETQAPIVQPTTQPSTPGRKFDGASFVGGIILGIVLTGIFIFAFKWWQSRNKSYHSL